jgi:hypothetical protein
MSKRQSESRKGNPESEYDQEKRKFERVLGKPSFTINVEIPSGYEHLHRLFLQLEDEEGFHADVQKLVKKWLRSKKQVPRKREPDTSATRSSNHQ